jgi:hypothetical protein
VGACHYWQIMTLIIHSNTPCERSTTRGKRH